MEDENEMLESATEGGDVQADEVNEAALIDYDFRQGKEPSMLACSTHEFKNNFLKGCKWSPDGSHLLACSEDCRMRLFALPAAFYTGDFSQPMPEMRSSLSVKEGGTIYDYDWFPWMSHVDESTFYFITASQNAPIHMWSGANGELISTYKTINHMDELDVAYSLSFTPDGSSLYAGSTKKISVFDVARPGQQIDAFSTHKKRHTGQHGIISCFDFSYTDEIFAAGSYARSVAVYDKRDNSQTMIFEGHTGGVTQVKFSRDGNLLFSGARKDNELLVWDMRNPGKILAVLTRNVQTNQRMYFSIDPSSRYLCSGNYDGRVNVWHLSDMNTSDYEEEQAMSPCFTFTAHDDCVNACSFHPLLAMIATCSGQRYHPPNTLLYSGSDSDSSSDDEDQIVKQDFGIKLFWLGL